MSSVRFVWGVYVFIFVTYLCYSYTFVFLSTFSAMTAGAAVLIGAVFALGIIRVIGETSKAIYAARQNAGGKGWIWVPVTMLPALFLTVLALLPTSVWAFLGPDVVTKDLRYASTQIGTMQANAEGWLQVPAYETMRAEVEKLSQLLWDEIHSAAGGNFCGVGKAANATIMEIHNKYFPQLYVYPGTTDTHACSDREGIDRIANRYRDQINLFMKNSDLAVRYEIAKRKQFLADLIPAAGREIRALDNRADDLARISSFVASPGDYTQALETLESATRFYSASYASLVAFHPNNVPDTVIRDLDISHSQSIGRSTQIVATYTFLPMSIKKILIVILSLGADLLAVYLTFLRLRERGGPRQANTNPRNRQTVGGVALLN